jgi:NAD(P)-dependent dehydrogenase (short-subunit alcohol dehydrogenase family)
MSKSSEGKKQRKPQEQNRPGNESEMSPRPVYDYPEIKGSGKLKGKAAVITGGDSGIGRAVAILFAKEGADIAVLYLNEHGDAKETKKIIESRYGRKCILIDGDISDEKFCRQAIKKAARKFGKIDVLVNNAAMHYEDQDLQDVSSGELKQTFAVNIFSMFYLTKESLRYMKKGSAIINTSSVTAYRGSANLINYASTKGAIISFTRSLAASLIEKEIRVNAVAPGPIWTPLIAASFDADKVARHGSGAPMKRAGQPAEVAPCYLFLSCRDSAYMSGQVLHPNGGEVVNG